MEIRVITEKPDFTKHDEKPTKFVDQLVYVIQLDEEKTSVVNIKLRRNIIATVDKYFNLGNSVKYEFWDIETRTTRLELSVLKMRVPIHLV